MVDASDIVLALLGTAAAILLIHRLGWTALRLSLAAASALPPRIKAWRGWSRLHPFQARAAERFPRLHAALAARLAPRSFTGLPLTLLVAAALYIAALAAGLVEDFMTEPGVAAFDTAVNDALRPWRHPVLVGAMLWVTQLGASPALTAISLVATALLWSHGRSAPILPLWVNVLGAQATTWLGKFALGRERPVFETLERAISPSFPSAHATGAAAVYGFLAYLIARDLPRGRLRFEVGYWTVVLILMIAFSRIFLGVHYASDVACGLLVGAFWLLVGFTQAEWRRHGARAPD